jgi:hypothetical protein
MDEIDARIVIDAKLSDAELMAVVTSVAHVGLSIFEMTCEPDTKLKG